MNKEQTLEFLDILIALLPEEDKQALVDFRDKIADEEEPVEEEVIENKIKSLIKNQSFVTIKQFEELRNKVVNSSNNNPQPKPTMENVLKSKSYEDKFIAIFANQFISADQRKEQLKALQIENGLSGEEVLFPVRIAEGIRSRVMEDEFVSKLQYFGIENLEVPVTLSENIAKEHTKGKTKTDAIIELTNKALHSKAVYAKLPLDYVTMRKASASLYAWVVDKLAQIVIETIEKAVLVGVEGITSFTAVKADTAVYSTSVTASGEGVTRDDVVALVDAIQYRGNDLTLVVSKPTLSALRREIVATGGTPAYIKNTDLAEMLGVNSIITRDYVEKAIVFAPSAYGLVGDRAPEKIEQYDIKVNAQEIELVGLFGGALVELKSASYLA